MNKLGIQGIDYYIREIRTSELIALMLIYFQYLNTMKKYDNCNNNSDGFHLTL